MATQEILNRVAALLARAGHPATPDEEARTSAHIAARLIREHRLIVVTAVSPSERTRQQGQQSERPRPQRDGSRGGSWRAQPQAEPWKVYRASRPGICQACRRSFDFGARISWRNDIGPVHVGC